MKQYHKQQEEIAHIKKFIASVSSFWQNIAVLYAYIL